MRSSICLLAAVVAISLLNSGCAGPEQKLGRGIRNITEFTRLGEIRRSVEQTSLWKGPDTGYTTGFVKGMNLTLARTLVGAYEVLTFPIPSYERPFKYTLSEYPAYPDSYKPGWLADPMFGPDANLGFAGGDVMPFLPGSRFRVFDY